MPRATRAALRAQEIAEEAANVALPPTPTKERVPLGEISGNTNGNIMRDEEEPVKKPNGKSKKGRGGKKGKKGAKANVESENNEIVEDDNESSPSDAADEASNELMRDVRSAIDSIVLADRACTPPSPAVEAATQQLQESQQMYSQSSQPSLSIEEDQENQKADPTNGALLVESKDVVPDAATSMSPEVPQDDSFVERIKSRSPAKRVSRIEDSVEALDRLEDEIEQVGQAIPAAASDQSSPADARKLAKSAKPKTSALQSKGKPSKAQARPINTAAQKAAKPTSTPKGLNARPSAVGSIRKSTLHSASSPSRQVEPSKAAPDPPKSQAPPKRVSSIHRAPFQPTKSSKPPTKSTFELPGEAIARKLKEQREERQKREQETHATANAPRPRAKRPSQAPEVKMTATARARLSLAQNPPDSSSKPSATSKVRGDSHNAGVKRQSTLNSKTKPPAQPVRRNSPSANISAKREPSVASRQLSGQPSSSSPRRSVPSTEQLLHQKTRGKEVFGRHRTMLSEKELERKAKEEAAKKARIEAAERGRLASREWAEKQKARKLAAQKAKVDG